MKILFKLIILFSFLLPDASSNEEIKYNIEGNKRISNETILNIIDFRKNKKYNVDDLNEFQKKLFNTNYFSNVSIKIIKNKINIIVKENPIIDFFYINGVINNKREDFLYENLSLGQNKIFSDALLKKDIEKIKEIYQDGGYFDVTVKTEISKISGNALNVVINIDRKEKYQIKRIYFIGNKKFDHIIKVETFKDDLDKLSEFYGLPIITDEQLPHTHASVKEWDEEAMSIINSDNVIKEFYQEDIAIYENPQSLFKTKCQFPIINSSIKINKDMPKTSFEYLKLKTELIGKKILVCGLTYKEDTNDIRNSPTLDLIKLLWKKSSSISVYDPWVEKINLHSKKIKLVNIPDFKHDIIIFTVAHKIFKKIDFGKINKKTKVFDLNNCVSTNQINRLKRKKIQINILGRN